MTLTVPLYLLKRRAKARARALGEPLHAALDHIAQEQGFTQWSHLVRRRSQQRPATRLFQQLRAGECVLLAGRPGHGKTLLGLELLIEAVRQGHATWFFSLESTVAEVNDRVQRLGADNAALEGKLTVDCSDDVCAAYIAEQLSQAPRGAVAVVDFLQILDQRRDRPALADQVRTLTVTAQSRDATIIVLSQIDRHFDSDSGAMPSRQHLRLPNPVDIGGFSKACFIHNGKVQVEPITTCSARR